MNSTEIKIHIHIQSIMTIQKMTLFGKTENMVPQSPISGDVLQYMVLQRSSNDSGKLGGNLKGQKLKKFSYSSFSFFQNLQSFLIWSFFDHFWIYIEKWKNKSFEQENFVRKCGFKFPPNFPESFELLYRMMCSDLGLDIWDWGTQFLLFSFFFLISYIMKNRMT